MISHTFNPHNRTNFKNKKLHLSPSAVVSFQRAFQRCPNQATSNTTLTDSKEAERTHRKGGVYLTCLAPLVFSQPLYHPSLYRKIQQSNTTYRSAAVRPRLVFYLRISPCLLVFVVGLPERDADQPHTHTPLPPIYVRTSYLSIAQFQN